MPDTYIPPGDGCQGPIDRHQGEGWPAALHVPQLSPGICRGIIPGERQAELLMMWPITGSLKTKKYVSIYFTAVSEPAEAAACSNCAERPSINKNSKQSVPISCPQLRPDCETISRIYVLQPQIPAVVLSQDRALLSLRHLPEHVVADVVADLVLGERPAPSHHGPALPVRAAVQAPPLVRHHGQLPPGPGGHIEHLRPPLTPNIVIASRHQDPVLSPGQRTKVLP